MLENRPILIATIGYIIGIIMGLYCKISIALIYLIILLIYLIFSKEKYNSKKFKLISFKRYFRYIKLIFTKKVIKFIIIFSIISNSIILFQNYKYENLYKDLDGKDINISAIIVQKSSEKYKIKVKTGKYKNTYLFAYLKNNELECGDQITIEGTYSSPKKRTNYKGFDYSNHLKTLKVYGTIKVKKANVNSNNNLNLLVKINENLKSKIELRIQKSNLSSDEKALVKALLIGEKEELDSQTIEDFSGANISHLLAISGMHISYIIIFTNFIFNRLIGKHNSKPITSLVIFVYMGIAGYPPSLTRAGITGIVFIMSNFFYRRNDTWEALLLSLFILLLYNPYLIQNIGLELSFMGVVRNTNIYANSQKVSKHIFRTSKQTSN